MSTGSDAFAAAGVQLATALAGAANDPADAIRLLIPLAGFVPVPIAGSGPVTAHTNAAQVALAANLRAAACGALATATAAYQPISYQDAQAVRIAVCGALDAEATRVADAGLDASYQALRTLRAAVALDLGVRGANLAWLVEINTAASMPSLAEAWTLYQDTTREPGMVAAADVRHPLFMPLSFPALNA